MKNIMAVTAVCSALMSTSAFAEVDHSTMDHSHHAHHAGHHDRPDAHGPASIMGDHVHEEGKLMLSYRFMTMNMSGMRNGSDGISIADVHNDFMVTPTKMTMDMHMFGAMYGITDKFTVMGMLPYVKNKMEHQRRNGTRFNRTSSGFGDFKLSGIYNAYNNGNNAVNVGFGVSLPTGSVDERDPNGARLPYAMQLGSGTYDLLPSVTYTGYEGDYSWGGQAKGTIRLGENNNNYTLGDKYEADVWTAKKLNDRVSLSARLGAMTRDDIEGSDTELNQAMVPTARPYFYGKEVIDVGVGINFAAQSESFSGNRLGVEVSAPIYQDVNGSQLGEDWVVSFVWKVSF